MPDLVYPYLVEGTVFDAFALNSRFGATGAPGFGINAVMPYAAKRGAFQEVHLPATGIIAGEEFTSGFTVKINPTTDQVTDDVYVGQGNNNQTVLSDGVQDLEIMFNSPINFGAGMAGAQKVGGVLILANVHFMRASLSFRLKEGPLGFMIQVQYLDDSTGIWNAISLSERFSNERIISVTDPGGAAGPVFPAGTPLGDGPFDRTRDGGDPTEGDYLEQDVYTFQDIPLRLWLDENNFAKSDVGGFRVVGGVVDLGNDQFPDGYGTGGNPNLTPGEGAGYYREANLSVIPFHVEINP